MCQMGNDAWGTRGFWVPHPSSASAQSTSLVCPVEQDFVGRKGLKVLKKNHRLRIWVMKSKPKETGRWRKWMIWAGVDRVGWKEHARLPEGGPDQPPLCSLPVKI